jgi:ABC-type long-subunit fatty acid transport system fused permease/ATPase subunit
MERVASLSLSLMSTYSIVAFSACHISVWGLFFLSFFVFRKKDRKGDSLIAYGYSERGELSL